MVARPGFDANNYPEYAGVVNDDNLEKGNQTDNICKRVFDLLIGRREGQPFQENCEWFILW
jgi:hypothetical protein